MFIGITHEHNMDTKNIAPNKPIDGTKFLEMLSTVSLDEVLKFEFRKSQSQKWGCMVFRQEDGRKYHCNSCNVVQFGDKNLFSHLSGKKHNALLISIPQLQIRIKPNGAPKPAAGTGANNKINSPSVLKNPIASNNNKVQNKNDNNVAKPAAGNAAVRAQPSPKSTPNASGNAQKKATPNAAGSGGNNQANKTAQSPGMKKGPSLAGTSNANKNSASPNSSGQKAQAQAKPQAQTQKQQPQSQSQKTQTQSQPQKQQPQPQKSQPQSQPQKPQPQSQKPQSQSQSQTQKPQPQQKPQTQQKTSQDQAKTQGQQKAQQGQNGQSSNAKNIPNIVKNPLATKISCVPLAKLLSPTPEPQSDGGNDDVIVIEEDQPGSAGGNKNLAGPKNNKPNNQTGPNQGASKQPIPNQAGPRQNMPNQAAPRKNQPLLKTPVSNQAAPRNLVPIQRVPDKSAGAPVRPNAEKVITPSFGGPSIPRVTPSFPGAASKPARPDGATFESKSHQDEIMGLVGVEYVLKIVRSLTDPHIRYLCCLCDITSTEQAMHNHLLGYNHRLKYFDKHYPTAMRQYRQFVSNVPEGDVCKIMMPIFEKLAMAIETHHGRKASFQCYEHFFTKDRQTLISKAFNRWHASEKVGPSFTHVVDSLEVDQLIKNARNNVQAVMNMENPNPYICPTYESPQQPVSNYMGYQNMPVQTNVSNTLDDETHKRMVENFLRDTRHSSGDNQKSRGSKRPRSISPEQRKRQASNPMKNKQWNVERWSVSPLRDGDIWQAYRHMVDMKVRELNTSFETYKSDPEQHPNYQSEWQMFWKRRKDELIQAGVNHRNYNFQNEWIHFFNNRLEELYNQDIENIKIKCRERLCLPMTNHELSNKKYHVNVPETVAAPVINNKPVANKEPVQKMAVDEEAPPNVIHVLRLLTALEDYLGSLGPFITEMLAKALQVQKLYPEKIHTLTLTSENCAILETAKEKFTGLLISQIYDPTKERALKKAISDTELLLQVASKYSSPKDTASLPFEKQTPQIVNRIQQNVEKPLDKTELAAKLASSLVSQGKTSINREELQKILQVYNLIEQKKRQDVVDPSNSGNNLPSNSGIHLPSNSGSHLPSNSGSHLPSNSGSHLPSNSGNHLPTNSGNHLPTNSGNHLPRNPGNFPSTSGNFPTSTYSGNSVAPVRAAPLLANPITNDNLLTQHSARNLNVANNASNATSMYTGQNYSSNVARFNNQNTNNIPNTPSAFSADRGFGSGVSSSAYQSSQFGTGTPAMNPSSSVLRNNISSSSLFNFNTHLNPSYNNNNNTSRRNF